MSCNFVIGGGWSLKQWASKLDDLMSLGHVIGVNDAGWRVDCHEALTMDRLWFEHRWPMIKEKNSYGFHTKTWVREKCDCNVPRKDERDDWQTFKHFDETDPSEVAGELHGGNSGTCAINLAFQRMLDGDCLYLLGFDMQKGPHGEPYWYEPYPWAKPEGATKPGHFRTWVKDMLNFAQYARRKGFNVYNVTTRSEIPYFPKITFEQMMEMVA